MGPCIMVRSGTSYSSTGSWSVHGRADGGEGGGELVQGRCGCGTRVADGEGNELHPSPSSFEAAKSGEYFSVFSSSLMSHPRSLQKPTSTMIRVQFFLSKEVGSG